MEQTIVMLAQEITRLRIIEQKYLELISKQTSVPVIEISVPKIKNPKRVAAGIQNAKNRAIKKLALKEVYEELLENAQLEWTS